MARRNQTVALVYKLGKKTITISVESRNAFEDKIMNAAEKIYDQAYVFGDLVKTDFISMAEAKIKAPTISPADKIKEFSDAVIKALPAYCKKIQAADKKSNAKAAAERKKEAAEFKKKMAALIKANPLPEFLKLDDLIRPDDDDTLSYDKRSEFFSSSDMAWSSTPLYHVAGWGWCLPVLRIKSGSSRGATDRAYATRLSDGAQVRVGLGPHVTATADLYLKKENYSRLLKSLKPLLDTGAVKANQTRDELSTRRMNSRRRRSIFGGF